MSSKPETQFASSVHRHLRDVYAEKMNNPYRSGTADWWYSGSKGDLWVEYKFLRALPTRVNVRADLSAQQLRWLTNRRREGRRIEVLIGYADGGVVLTVEEWHTGLDPAAFIARTKPRTALAEWIRGITGPSPCLSLPVSSLPSRSPELHIG